MQGNFKKETAKQNSHIPKNRDPFRLEMHKHGRGTDPESAPDEDCPVICKSSGVTVSCRHLHHLLVQQHLPWNHLRALLGRFPAEGAFVVTAKSVDLKNQKTWEFILETQKPQMKSESATPSLTWPLSLRHTVCMPPATTCTVFSGSDTRDGFFL